MSAWNVEHHKSSDVLRTPRRVLVHVEAAARGADEDIRPRDRRYREQRIKVCDGFVP